MSGVLRLGVLSTDTMTLGNGVRNAASAGTCAKAMAAEAVGQQRIWSVKSNIHENRDMAFLPHWLMALYSAGCMDTTDCKTTSVPCFFPCA